mgnify:CR=1 FL=1
MYRNLVTALLVTFFLSACVYPGHHHGKKVKKSKIQKASRVLDQEHKSGTIIIVTRIPAKGQKCWGHKKHWHCQR